MKSLYLYILISFFLYILPAQAQEPLETLQAAISAFCEETVDCPDSTSIIPEHWKTTSLKNEQSTLFLTEFFADGMKGVIIMQMQEKENSLKFPISIDRAGTSDPVCWKIEVLGRRQDCYE